MICESDKRASQLCQVCSYANGDAISDQLLQPLRRNAVTDTQTDIWKIMFDVERN